MDEKEYNKLISREVRGRKVRLLRPVSNGWRSEPAGSHRYHRPQVRRVSPDLRSLRVLRRQGDPQKGAALCGGIVAQR